MKTSNKLLIVAFLVLITSLFGYNFALLKVYKVQHAAMLKDLYYDYERLNIKYFEEIEINAATRGNIKIINGPYQVMIHKNDINKYASITKEGGKLKINATFPAGNYFPPYNIVIICPKISVLKTSARFIANGKSASVLADDYPEGRIGLYNFNQDSISIIANHASYIYLTDNKISFIKASLGEDAGSSSILEFHSRNQIEKTDINLLNKSQLKLNDISIPDLNYHFSDSAKVLFEGSSLKLLKQVNSKNQKPLN